MVRNQSRRSISISGTTYAALKAHCEKAGCSQSGVVEELLRGFLNLPDREALAAQMAKAPRVKAYDPIRDMETVIREAVPGPVSRVQVIKDSAAAKAAFVKPADPLTEAQRAAAKIFTF